MSHDDSVILLYIIFLRTDNLVLWLSSLFYGKSEVMEVLCKKSLKKVALFKYMFVSYLSDKATDYRQEEFQ
ncbi:hypothetical protein D3C73_703130 [compost metagenome]